MPKKQLSNFRKVLEFSQKYELPRSKKPTIINPKEFLFRLQFIQEETLEMTDAYRKKNIPEFADAIGDLLYVTYGLAVLSGIDADAVFDAIHEANMKKVRAKDAKNKRGHKNDVIKPAGWTPPDIAKVVLSQGEIE